MSIIFDALQALNSRTKVGEDRGEVATGPVWEEGPLAPSSRWWGLVAFLAPLWAKPLQLFVSLALLAGGTVWMVTPKKEPVELSFEKRVVDQISLGKDAHTNSQAGPAPANVAWVGLSSAEERPVNVPVFYAPLSSPKPKEVVHRREAGIKHRADPSPGRSSGIRISSRTTDHNPKGVGLITQALFDAMDGGDHEAVAGHLTRLQTMLGDQNPFVIKMQAYWYLRQENHHRAHRLLSQILDATPQDFEANLNMAVAEIGIDKLHSARIRLNGLIDRHPNHPKILSLLSLLPHSTSVQEP
ncbi:MAG: tetratricopeptide repeat protein [Magnetococcales bacterium]|nr:tetratricopeptide repeat protein [Magnetococcales bacterium]